MNRTLTELGFKIVSLRFVYPPFPLLPPPPDVVCPPPPNTLQYITISFCLLAVILKSITTQHGIYFRGGNVKFPQNSESPSMYKPLQK